MGQPSRQGSALFSVRLELWRSTGMANGASALIHRWKVQVACAAVWWVAAVAMCFGTDAQSLIVFLVANGAIQSMIV